jgi:hypothetical protein
MERQGFSLAIMRGRKSLNSIGGAVSQAPLDVYFRLDRWDKIVTDILPHT